MLFQDLSEISVAELTARVKARAFEARKREAEKSLDYYWGNQKAYLEGLLDEHFGVDEAASLRKQAAFLNFVRRVTDEVSLIYKEAPKRIFSENPKGQALAEGIYKNARADLVLKHISAYAWLLGTVFLKIAFRRGQIELDVLTPDLVDVIQDGEDPTRAKALITAQTLYDTPGLEVEYTYWGEDGRHLKFDSWGKPKNIPGNPDGVNPYRDERGESVLPFVVFRRDFPDGRFFVEGMADLICAQDVINVKLTELSYLIKMQSFGQPVFKGMDDEHKQIAVGPGKPIRIPLHAVAEGADFKYESPHGKIDEVWGFIKEFIALSANQHGLSPENFSLTGGVKSGFALSMEDRRLSERRDKDRDLYRLAEAELYSKIRLIHNTHRPEAPLPEGEFTVEFPEPVRGVQWNRDNPEKS